MNLKRKVWLSHLRTHYKRWSFFSDFTGEGCETHNKSLNIKQNSPEHILFFVFFRHPEKLGGFIRFHRKRVTSCGSRNRTCVVELMRLSWCLLQSTPPYRKKFRTCYRLAKTMTEVILFSQVHTRPLFWITFVTITVAVICFTYTLNAKESRSHFPHIQQ